MDNAIPTRIHGFLKRFPPFSIMNEDELMQISKKVVVRYVQPEEIVFMKGDLPGEYIYIVKDGAIKLLTDVERPEKLVDVCDEGDVFGLRPVMADDNYLLTAKAKEESLLYCLKVESLTPFIDRNPDVAMYLAKSFASGRYVQFRNKKGQKIWSGNKTVYEEINLEEIQSINHSKSPITCHPKTTIKEAAQKMRHHNVGSIIAVSELSYPLGIITDRDLRNHVVTGEYGLHTEISELMSKPVVTIPPGITIAEVQIQMMNNNVHHLCITESGKVDSKVVGVISEHDLMVIQGRNPATLIKEIRRSNDIETLITLRDKAELLLIKYLEQDVSISFISKIITAINDALVVKAIEISTEELQIEGEMSPDVKWCWMAIGSSGRQEQLLRTDQDNAIIFEDVAPDEIKLTKEYFHKLAKKTVDILHRCGFDYCPADMMASNPKWCLSISEWKEQFSKWINKPTEKNIMFCTIFFDFRAIFGETSLTEILSHHIIEAIDPESMFVVNLAKNAVRSPPPLTFFRNFMVEKNGEHKDEFDIKARAMMPLVDAARILTLTVGHVNVNNTVGRFEVMAEMEPQNNELFHLAAEAFEILMRDRALQGLNNKDTGRYINPAYLSKMERLNLRNSFKPTTKLQEFLMIRYRLSMFM